jgi:hypothetical protein
MGSGASTTGRGFMAGIAAVLGLLVGVLGTVGVVAATGGVQAQTPQISSTTSAEARGAGPADLSRGAGIAGGGEGTDSSLGGGGDDAGLRTITGQNIREYFSSYDASLQLPQSVTSGFVPGSFHLQVSSVSPKASTALYAAQRGDGQYCLVAVVGTARVAETCGNVADVATRGLTLTVESPGGGDDQALTVTWNHDGTLTDSSSPFVG